MKKTPIPTARQLALEILKGVENKKQYSNFLLQAVYRQHPLTPQEKALLRELVGGVLRQRGKLDWALNHLTRQKFGKTHPIIRNIMRLGAYQLLFLDGITAYAAVNESVRLAHQFGYKGSAALVNGVLRNLSKQKDSLPFPGLEKGPLTFLSVNHSHPEWIISRWLKRWNAKQVRIICQSANQSPTTGLRVNTLKVDLEECQDFLRQEGIITSFSTLAENCLAVEKGVDFSGSRAYQRGWIEIQSTVSQMAVQVLAPRPGERVLDLCAGRGVKSTQLAQLMDNRGQITAIDIFPRKLRQLQNNRKRLGINIINPVTANATADLPLNTNNNFERILLDAPCSALGVLGRYPEARWRKTPLLIKEMQNLQRKILKQAAKHLSTGGTLVYATCSLEPEENEVIIDEFLAKHPNWRAVPVENNSGIEQETDGYWRSWSKETLNIAINLGTPSLLGDGFFLAKLKRLN